MHHMVKRGIWLLFKVNTARLPLWSIDSTLPEIPPSQISTSTAVPDARATQQLVPVPSCLFHSLSALLGGMWQALWTCDGSGRAWITDAAAKTCGQLLRKPKFLAHSSLPTAGPGEEEMLNKG